VYTNVVGSDVRWSAKQDSDRRNRHRWRHCICRHFDTETSLRMLRYLQRRDVIWTIPDILILSEYVRQFYSRKLCTFWCFSFHFYCV